MLAFLAMFAAYSYQLVYLVELPLYRGVFVDEGHDLLNDRGVVLPQEYFLNEFVPDTMINSAQGCYSTIVINDKKSGEARIYEVLQNKDVDYAGMKIRLVQFSFSKETESLYYIIEIEQRRYQRWID